MGRRRRPISYMRKCPGLARRLPYGLRRPARSQSRAHVHSACAFAQLALRLCMCAWPASELWNFQLSVRAPRGPCTGACGIRPVPCAGCRSRCAHACAAVQAAVAGLICARDTGSWRTTRFRGCGAGWQVTTHTGPSNPHHCAHAASTRKRKSKAHPRYRMADACHTRAPCAPQRPPPPDRGSAACLRNKSAHQ